MNEQRTQRVSCSDLSRKLFLSTVAPSSSQSFSFFHRLCLRSQLTSESIKDLTGDGSELFKEALKRIETRLQRTG